jgi:DNA polymerase III subunit epsilon
MKDIWVSVDTETTGLSFRFNNMVEIGAIKFQLDPFVELGRFSSLINPKASIPQEATRVHGITDEDVLDKPTFKDLSQDFLAFIKDSILIGYNLSFDLSFIDHELMCAGIIDIESQKHKCLDVLRMVKRQLPHLPSHKLSAIASQFNIVPEATHRAIDDADTCLKVFLSIYGRIKHNLDPYECSSKLNLKNMLKGKFGEILLGGRYEIEYESKGKFTQRTIQVKKIVGTDNGAMILAFCEFRGEERTFNASKIKKAIMKQSK